jgi:hypothetical protein
VYLLRSQLERHIEVFANSTLCGRDAEECAAIGPAVGAVRGDIIPNQLEIAPAWPSGSSRNAAISSGLEATSD